MQRNALVLTLVGIAVVLLVSDPSLAVAQETAFGEVDRVENYAGIEGGRFGLNDGVVVHVKGATDLQPGRLRDISPVLFIDGQALEGVLPTSNHVDSLGNGEIRFFLGRRPEAIELWGDLMAAHRGFESELEVSVGIDAPLPAAEGADNRMTVVLARRQWALGASLIVAVVLIAFTALALRTDLLRDAGGANLEPGVRGTWSLARVAMSVWTLSILASWLGLYVFRHTMDTVTDSLVGLMGLSAGTTAGAALIESRSASEFAGSQGIVQDLLCDDEGWSFQRFQFLAWTLVTVVIFWRQVYFYLKMPEFPNSVLLLITISSASYLGGKGIKTAPLPGEDPQVDQVAAS